MVELLNIDCMEYMASCKDNEFDLAIVDPPYGIGAGNMQMGKGVGTDSRTWINKDWDNEIPKREYFSELKRVSKNQIIWGGNYFDLPPTRCNVIWDKIQEFSGSDFELAWTSFDKPSKAFRTSRVEAYTNQTKIHPTQKPIKLYKWLLDKYAEKGQRILDTHLGSGSSAIAAYYFGCDFIGCEIDEDYYLQMLKRYDLNTRQLQLF